MGSRKVKKTLWSSVPCCRGLWMMQIDTWPWSHICWGHMHLIGPKACKWDLTNWPHITFDLYLWSLTTWTCEGSYIISINQVWFQLGFNFSNEVNITFTAHVTTSLLTLVYDLWPHKYTKGPISINQVWFQLDLNFSNEATFIFSAYLTTWPQMTFDLDTWPLTSSTNEGFHAASMTQLWLKSIKACGR